MPLVKDADGHTVPYDDDQIANEDCLLRRVNPEQHLEPLKEDQHGFRLSLSVFSESSKRVSKYGGMSSHLERLVANPLERLPSGWGLVRIVVGAIRAKGYLVGLDPEPNDDAHASVWRSPNGHAGRRVPVKEGEYQWVVLPTKMHNQ